MAKDTSKKDNAYKIKLLRLWDILRQETDEKHPISTQQLIARLSEEGIQCDRKVLARDIALLTDNDYEVMRDDKRIGHSNAYYVEDRLFDSSELRILIDAVRAASFISPDKTDELVKRIASLGGNPRAEQLMNGSTQFITRKHSNRSTVYSVSALDEAIRGGKQATFHYFRLNEKREKVYGHNGDFYIVNPVAMLCNEDNYYLVCWDTEKNSLRNYRIDRMEDTEALKTDAVIGITQEQLGESLASTFKMFGGEPVDIELAFVRDLIPVMQDRFGEALDIHPTEQPDVFSATVRVQMSGTFWGWIFQFVGQMKILSPRSAVKEYRRQARGALKTDPLDPESEYITEWDEDF